METLSTKINEKKEIKKKYTTLKNIFLNTSIKETLENICLKV